MNTENLPKLTVKEKAGYGCGDLASNFIWASAGNFQNFFYTDIFGLIPGAVALVMFFSRIFDGFVDVAVGAMADRTQTKWGKFRPYLVWFVLPVAILFVMNYTVPPKTWDVLFLTIPGFNLFGYPIDPAPITGYLLYAWITATVLMTFYSAINIPYGALSGVMTDDPNDRNSLGAYRMAFANIGGFIVTGLTIPLMIFFGTGSNGVLDKAKGYQGAVIVFAILMAIFFLVTFFWCKERIQPPPAQHTRFKDDFKTLFKNSPWIIMSVFAIINMTLVIARSSDAYYYYQYSIGLMDPKLNVLPIDLFGHHLFNWDKTSWLFVWGGITFVIGTMFTRPAAKLLGKKHAFILTTALSGVALIPFCYIPAGHVGTVMAVIFIAQFFSGIAAALYWSMLGDIADYSEWKFNLRNTGLIFSSTTFAQKAGMALGGIVLNVVLWKVAYHPNVAQTLEAQHGINLVMSYIPGIGTVLIALLFLGYILDDKFCAKMRDDLNQRRIERGQQPV
jgi:GPH family glycoside/pentoside/hexuronide:cation symporter